MFYFVHYATPTRMERFFNFAGIYILLIWTNTVWKIMWMFSHFTNLCDLFSDSLITAVTVIRNYQDDVFFGRNYQDVMLLYATDEKMSSAQKLAYNVCVMLNGCFNCVHCWCCFFFQIVFSRFVFSWVSSNVVWKCQDKLNLQLNNIKFELSCNIRIFPHLNVGVVCFSKGKKSTFFQHNTIMFKIRHNTGKLQFR